MLRKIEFLLSSQNVVITQIFYAKTFSEWVMTQVLLQFEMFQQQKIKIENPCLSWDGTIKIILYHDYIMIFICNNVYNIQKKIK